MRRRAAGVRAVTIVLALAGTACSRTSPLQTVEQFIDVANEHSIESAMELVADDVVIEFADGPALRGSVAVRGWFAWDSVVGTHMIAGRMRAAGDTVRLDALVVRNHWLLIMGLPEVVHGQGTRFVVGTDGIRSVRLAPLEPASRARLDRRLADVLAWARHEYPDRLGRIRRNDGFDMQARTATDWLSLVREWRTGRR